MQSAPAMGKGVRGSETTLSASCPTNARLRADRRLVRFGVAGASKKNRVDRASATQVEKAPRSAPSKRTLPLSAARARVGRSRPSASDRNQAERGRLWLSGVNDGRAPFVSSRVARVIAQWDVRGQD